MPETNLSSRIIVVDGKHSTDYLDASTPLAWAASSLMLLSERYYSGYYYRTPAQLFGAEDQPPYTAEQIEALKTLPENDPARKAAAQKISRYKSDNRQRVEYEQWWNQMVRVVEEQDMSFVSLRDGIDQQRIDRIARPLAWQLLDDRGDYEYERVSLENVRRPDSADS